VNPAHVRTHLASHPWLAEAHAGSQGALLLLNPSGHAALRRHGRSSLLTTLQSHLAANTAYQLRLLDAAPGELSPPAVDRWLDTSRPDCALPLAESEHDGRWTLTLQLPLELVHFDDHFQQAPVLPGVLQVGWALALAAPRLGTSVHCREMEALKFQRLLRPGDRIELGLRFEADADDAGRGKLHFAYHLDGAHCSSGRLRVERAHG
jgi:3-hydroxymyristoyl/3-hydroxydecanoyl-(acyl carrier protein) dehydratase